MFQLWQKFNILLCVGWLNTCKHFQLSLQWVKNLPGCEDPNIQQDQNCQDGEQFPAFDTLNVQI